MKDIQWVLQRVKSSYDWCLFRKCHTFSSYNFGSTVITNYLNKNNDKNQYTTETLPFLGKILAGGFAGFMASFVLTPVELVKCQLQVSNLSLDKSHHTYGTIIKSTIRDRGIIGLWKGLNSTIVREVIGTAIWFGTYEYVNDYYKRSRNPGLVIRMYNC